MEALMQRPAMSDEAASVFYSCREEEFEQVGCDALAPELGRAFKARHKRTGKHVAVKRILVSDDEHLESMGRAVAELYSPSASPQPQTSQHVVDFVGGFYSAGTACVAVEQMDGSLADLMCSGHVPAHVLAELTKSVLEALRYLHCDRGLAHRNIKPGNILYRKDGTIKLTDFGDLQERSRLSVDSVSYVSPQRLRGEVARQADDIWSLGLTLLAVGEGSHPFATMFDPPSVWEVFQHVCDSDKPVVSFPDGMAGQDDFKRFVSRCLVRGRAARAKVTDLLDDPWVVGNTEPDPWAGRQIIATWIAGREPEVSTVEGSGRMSADELDKALSLLVDTDSAPALALSKWSSRPSPH